MLLDGAQKGGRAAIDVPLRPMEPRRLLIIDDDDSFLAGVEHAIPRSEWVVDIATEIDQAAVKIDERGYDLLLMDIALTGLSIDEALAMLVRSIVRHPDRAVVIVTAYASPYLIRVARNLGVRAVLQKPGKVEEVLGAIGQ